MKPHYRKALNQTGG